MSAIGQHSSDVADVLASTLGMPESQTVISAAGDVIDVH
jgi:hypothetical protein